MAALSSGQSMKPGDLVRIQSIADNGEYKSGDVGLIIADVTDLHLQGHLDRRVLEVLVDGNLVYLFSYEIEVISETW